MKKILKIIAAAVVSTAFIGSFASAATCNDIVINNSGDDATNTVTCKSVTDVTVECKNNVIVANANYQNAQTGDATGSGNQSSGSVKSGTAVNYNGTDTTVGATCGAAESPAPTPAPVTPAGGKGGAGATTAAAPGKGAFAPAALPYTGGNTGLIAVVTTLAVAGSLAAGSRFAIATYRRFGSK